VRTLKRVVVPILYANAFTSLSSDWRRFIGNKMNNDLTSLMNQINQRFKMIDTDFNHISNRFTSDEVVDDYKIRVLIGNACLFITELERCLL